MIMSSFLMNPVSAGAALPSSYQQPQHLTAAIGVDPKFPPNEEYSQSNYIPSSGADFFGGHHIAHPQHHLQYSYHNHHQATTTPYGAPSVPISNGGYGGYGNYYHPQIHSHHPTPLHSHQLRPAIPIHPESQQPQVPCGGLQAHQPPQQPAVSNANNILQSLADITPSATQTSDVNSGVCSPSSVGHGQDSRGSPPGHTLQELGLRLEDTASDEQDDIEDDQLMDGSPLMDDDDDDDSENGDRVIYPWMKKIHVAGVGEYQRL